MKITKEKLLKVILFNQIIIAIDFGMALFNIIIAQNIVMGLFFFGLACMMGFVNKMHYKTMARLEDDE